MLSKCESQMNAPFARLTTLVALIKKTIFDNSIYENGLILAVCKVRM